MDVGIKMICTVFSFLLGAMLSSFAGVVAFRVPKKISIIKPDSYCPSCNTPIRWYDNIPILSYIILGGKCRNCNNKIGISSFLCELFGGLFFMFAFLQYEISIYTLLLFVLIILFVIIASIDFETHVIYNNTLVLFFILAVLIFLYNVIYLKNGYWNYLIGGLVGGLFFLIIRIVAKVILKKEALGSGDIYLTGIAGLMLGVVPLLLAIMVGTLLGSIIELIRLKISKIDRETEIAFAPYLLFGFMIMAIFGQAILDFYFKVVM